MTILLIIILILAPLSIGYASGYMKYNNTENHYAKAVFAGCFFGLLTLGIYYQFDLYNLLSALLLWKPLHDFGYTYGDKNLRGKYLFYVGETSWDDRFIQWTGIWFIQTNTNFPILYIIYFFMMFFGVCVNGLSYV